MSDGTAAQMLDEFHAWVLLRAAEFPIRSGEFDEAILRAQADSEVEALRAYRHTRSPQSGFAAARRTFNLEMLTWQAAPEDQDDPLFTTARPPESKVKFRSVG